MGGAPSNLSERQLVEGKALISATLRADLTAVEALLKKEGSEQQTVRDEEGYVAVHWAGRYDLPDILRKLLDADPTLLAFKSTPEEHTVLHLTAYFGSVDAAHVALDFAPDVNVRDKDGRTPLHLAAYNGQHEVLQLLLKSGADVHARTNSGRQALHLAAYFGGTQSISHLLEAGADIDPQDLECRVPAHLATARGNVDSFRALLEAGANKDARTIQGHTVLHRAVIFRQIEAVRLIMELGFPGDARDVDGFTARGLAEKNGYHEIAKLLPADEPSLQFLEEDLGVNHSIPLISVESPTSEPPREEDLTASSPALVLTSPMQMPAAGFSDVEGAETHSTYDFERSDADGDVQVGTSQSDASGDCKQDINLKMGGFKQGILHQEPASPATSVDSENLITEIRAEQERLSSEPIDGFEAPLLSNTSTDDGLNIW